MNSAPSQKKLRDSSIELYRIIVMLLIVAHHYVVNSEVSQLMQADSINAHSVFFYIFGAWGKTGINCFVLITGYYMCTSHISLRKYLKLYFEIKFYQYVIWGVFFVVGMSSFSYKTILGLLPFTIIGTSFTNAFMAFYLYIPFLIILVKNLTKRQHFLLIVLSLWIYSILGQMKLVTFNYVTWFAILFLIASFIRFYGLPQNDNRRMWGYFTVITFVLAVLSIYATTLIGKRPTYGFVSDSNAVFALLLSVSSFMYFKNVKIEFSKTINIIGSTTFGVFLIHTRGDEMRHWLWYNVVDCGGHYAERFFWIYAILVVVSIFTVCSLIDWLRKKYIEYWTLKKLDPWINRIEKHWKLKYEQNNS